MNIQIFGTNKCFDTKKAQRYFKERNIKFQFIDLAQKNFSKGEYNSVKAAVGSMEALINEKSKAYEKHTGQMALSADPEEYWHSGDNPEGAELILDLGDEYDIDKIVLGEHIRTGQQIEKFKLYAMLDGKWKKLAAETVIGYKRICRFDEIRVRYFKLVIEKARCFATISKFEAY